MKKNDKEKTKKIAVVAGLVTVGALAIVGISFTLRREEPATQLSDEREVTTTVNINNETAEPTAAPTVSPSVEPTKDPEIVISLDVTTEVKEEGAVQSIQPDPVKTEEVKPSEPPADIQNVDTANKNNPPKNTEIPAATTKPDTTNERPQNGTVRDGKIYVEGFGWVDYEGGGTNVMQGNEIYQNGNTIGTMD